MFYSFIIKLKLRSFDKCIPYRFIFTPKHFCRRQAGHQLRRALSITQLLVPAIYKI